MTTAVPERLLVWFAANGRDLPWRHERTPYRVTVAEFMLQQTQVQQVIPYYQRWLQRYPSWNALAAAPLDDVLKLWEGLGYYNRARRLHQLAKTVVAKYNGALPDTEKALLALPGIGRYTAGAILSLAFGRDTPLLDGNVRRVLARLYAWDGDLRDRAGHEWLWEQSRALIIPGQAGAINEALMDLGATICTPRSPHCATCPLADNCAGLASGRPEQFPRVAPHRVPPHHQVVAAVLQDDSGRFLFAQRPARGLLAGLWEFPGTDCGVAPADSPWRCLRAWLAEQMGAAEATVGKPLPTLQHAYTHFRLTLHPFRVAYPAGPPNDLVQAETVYQAWRWATAAEAKQEMALTRVSARLLAQLEKEG